MRAKVALVLASFLLMSLVLPHAALAKTVTVIGSLTITKCVGMTCTTALTTEIVAGVVTSNPGFEKTTNWYVQGPPFTVPAFVQGGSFDTLIIMTDLTGMGVTVKLTLRDLNGSPVALATDTFAIPANGTVVVSLSDQLP